MTAHELELIHADLMVAKEIKDSPEGRRDNPYMMNMVAYHSAQAIEKSLKAVIRGAGREDDELFYTHNISELIMEVQAIRPNFSTDYEFIQQNARRLNHANELRYGDSGIAPATASGLLWNANKLFVELEEEYMKETSFDRKDIRRIAKEHYETLPKFRTYRPDLQNTQTNDAEENKPVDKDITE